MNRVTVALLAIAFIVLAAPAALAQGAPPPVAPGQNQTPAVSYAPAPTAVFWSIFGVMAIVVVVGMLQLGRILTRDKDWNLADAMSGPDGKPSSSRLIAFLGLLVIVALILGIGYSTLWVFLQTGQLPSLSGATTFLIACAGLFTPYLASQIGQALGSQPAPQVLAPVVMQTANSALPIGSVPTPPNVIFGAPVRPPSL